MTEKHKRLLNLNHTLFRDYHYKAFMLTYDIYLTVVENTDVGHVSFSMGNTVHV